MKKFSLLLLDANVIIILCKVGLWGHVLERCEILLARTVYDESFFYETDSGDVVHFSLEEDVDANRIKLVEVPLAEVMAFKARFTQLYDADIHSGEAESLAFLENQEADHSICSSDKIVFRVLGCLGKGEQGLSLEIILRQCGLTKKLPREFGEEYRKHWTGVGVTDGIQGRAMK